MTCAVLVAVSCRSCTRARIVLTLVSHVGVVLVLVLVSCSRRTGVVLALVLMSCSLVSRGYYSLADVVLAHVLLAYLLVVLAHTMICLLDHGTNIIY